VCAERVGRVRDGLPGDGADGERGRWRVLASGLSGIPQLCEPDRDDCPVGPPAAACGAAKSGGLAVCLQLSQCQVATSYDLYCDGSTACCVEVTDPVTNDDATIMFRKNRNFPGT
jgi:hypothetical protein